jgi:pimeloyl-ACP methyl ester carboxylesterase
MAPSHLDLMWIDPGYTQVLRRLGGFAHAAVFDARGLGLSDPLDHVQTVEEAADDLAAVMDAARVERAVLLAMGTGYPAAAMFTARAPERVEGLVPVSPWAVGIDAVQDTSTIAGYYERMDHRRRPVVHARAPRRVLEQDRVGVREDGRFRPVLLSRRSHGLSRFAVLHAS